MRKLYMYTVDRDYGFAPNPFHGYCTLATCKPRIRNPAKLGDWVIGMGGGRLKATKRCIFAMRVTGKLTYNEYWADPRFLVKQPVRNGSSKMMVGDNIYHRDSDSAPWQQADSHHSHEDGSINQLNLVRDTKSDQVLISQHFFYFGNAAPCVPIELLDALGFKNGRGHRTFGDAYKTSVDRLIAWVETTFRRERNQVVADPFDFHKSEERYAGPR